MSKPELKVKSMAEVFEQHEREHQRLIANPKWGNWHLNRRTFELVNEKTGYHLDLDKCKDSAQILDWIFQISGKGGPHWDVDNLLKALRHILNPQANFCSMGKHKKANPRVVAKEWLKAVK
jgi:hypothetical protein